MQKHAKPDTDLMNSVKTLAGLAVAAAVIGGIVYFMNQASSKPIRVEVTMNKRCELIDDAFVAVAEPDGATAHFEKGVAVLNTFTDSRISVKASPRYPDFSIETGKVKAAPKVAVTVNCGTDRIESTIDAMRQQFKK